MIPNLNWKQACHSQFAAFLNWTFESAVIAALKAKMQQLERYLKLFIGILDIILAISNELICNPQYISPKILYYMSLLSKYFHT